MSQLLHLAGSSDLDRLEPMVAKFHAANAIESDETHRSNALLPLLEGSPLGAIWLIGPKMAPVGYVAVSFGWSIELGGLSGTIDEIWIREKVRGRGMGTEALIALIKALSQADLKALHLEVAEDNLNAKRIYKRLGFIDRPNNVMTWTPAIG